MKDLVFIQACPDDSYYIWQTHAWLESLRKLGKSDQAINCIFIPAGREKNIKWKILEKEYPESVFFYQEDTDQISKLLGIYTPILRPYILMKYWEANPDMKDKAVFYCDNDTLFTETFNVDHLKDDDICYLSNTNSYINANYFDSKTKDVLPEKKEEYAKRDILQETTGLVGITREIAVKNNNNSGGAQYLLKNIDKDFWNECITSVLRIRLSLQKVNKEFFESENKGFQSWCADMWAILWNLWKIEKETKVVTEMDFSWSSDSIFRVEQTGIFHNAGIVSEKQGEIPVFYKGKYHAGLNPFEDSYLDFLYTNDLNKTLANSYYVKALVDLKVKYNLKY